MKALINTMNSLLNESHQFDSETFNPGITKNITPKNIKVKKSIVVNEIKTVFFCLVFCSTFWEIDSIASSNASSWFWLYLSSNLRTWETLSSPTNLYVSCNLMSQLGKFSIKLVWAIFTKEVNSLFNGSL